MAEAAVGQGDVRGSSHRRSGQAIECGWRGRAVVVPADRLIGTLIPLYAQPSNASSTCAPTASAPARTPASSLSTAPDPGTARGRHPIRSERRPEARDYRPGPDCNGPTCLGKDPDRP